MTYSPLRYAVYDATTGVIAQINFSDSIDLVAAICGPAQAAAQVADDVQDDTHYITNGAAVAYPPRTRDDAVWSGAAWSDRRTLEQVKAQQWAQIKAKREAVEFGGFTWSASRFDSDAESQSRIQGAAQLATLAMLGSQPFSVDWTLADNTVRTLAIADMLAAGQAMGVHIMTTHGIGRALRTSIESATTAEAVEGVSWPV